MKYFNYSSGYFYTKQYKTLNSSEVAVVKTSKLACIFNEFKICPKKLWGFSIFNDPMTIGLNNSVFQMKAFENRLQTKEE